VSAGRIGYVEATRPQTRADCIDGPRPCPWTKCRHHLAEFGRNTHAFRNGVAKWAPPDGETCSLDVADRGEQTLETIGAILRVTRERVRQIEARALVKIRAARERTGLDMPCEPPAGNDIAA